MKKETKAKIKKFFSAIWKPFLWIAGLFTLIFIGKKVYEYARFGKIESGTHWHKIDSETISVFDKSINSYRRVTLPEDRRTGKKIKPEEIKAVGISEKKVVVDVQINHGLSSDIFLGNN